MESTHIDYQAEKERALIFARLHTRKKRVDRFFDLYMLFCLIPSIFLLAGSILSEFDPIEFLKALLFVAPLMFGTVMIAYLKKPIFCILNLLLFAYSAVLEEAIGIVGIVFTIAAYFFIRAELDLRTQEGYPYFNDRFYDDNERHKTQIEKGLPDPYERTLPVGNPNPAATPEPVPDAPGSLKPPVNAQMEELIFPQPDFHVEEKG